MVKINCHRHPEGHIVKPSDAAVLVDLYRNKVIELAYEPPLPDVAGVSDPDSLRQVTCPQADLDVLKNSRKSTEKSV